MENWLVTIVWEDATDPVTYMVHADGYNPTHLTGPYEIHGVKMPSGSFPWNKILKMEKIT